MDRPAFSVILSMLATDRAAHEDAKKALAEKQAEFERENAALFQAVAESKSKLECTESEVRDMAEAWYRESSEKKPVSGIEIKLFDHLDFDLPLAREWAAVNMPALLVLNTKAYEAVFKAVGADLAMPGQIVSTPKATIARDLKIKVDFLPEVE